MNKLMGFYELKDSNLPSVPWEVYDENTKLDSSLLWTVRVALNLGKDFNLPRIIGETASAAQSEARRLYELYKDRGMIIYYPYFIADKSGTLKVDNNSIVIEAVSKDLWNLVTYNKKDLTVIKSNDDFNYFGEKDFLSSEEISELVRYGENVRKYFREYIYSDKVLLLEWSYAYNSSKDKKPKGERYLVFYEIREI